MCISCFMFFLANDLLLAVYFIFILDYGICVRKQIWAIFLFEFKMGCKSVKKTSNFNNAFGPGIANKGIVQWWVKKFAKEMRALKMRSGVASYRKLTVTIESHHRSWSSYNYISCWRTQHWPFYGHSAFEANGKVKKLGKWVPHELTGKKNCFEVLSSLILCNNSEPLLNRIVTCNEKWFYMTTGEDQLSDCTKKLQSIS